MRVEVKVGSLLRYWSTNGEYYDRRTALSMTGAAQAATATSERAFFLDVFLDVVWLRRTIPFGAARCTIRCTPACSSTYSV